MSFLSRSYLGQVLSGFLEEKWSGAIRDTRCVYDFLLFSSGRSPLRDANAEIAEREQTERERERERERED